VSLETMATLVTIAVGVAAIIGAGNRMMRGLESRLTQRMDERFEQVDKRFEQVDKRFEQVDKQIEHVGQQIVEVARDLTQVRSELVEVKISVARLEGPAPGLLRAR